MAVVALGTFDGVHLGHRRLIMDALSFAKRKGFSCVVTTFDPHPQQFIVPERGLKLLTTVTERKRLIRSLGIKKIKVFRFNDKMSKTGHEAFIRDHIVTKLNAKVVFVGYDHAFGRGRSGGIKELRRLGKKHGFLVKLVKPFKIDGHPVKSSGIRKMIASGEFNTAFRHLGHPYSLTGKVVKGAGRGKLLGYPTANIETDPHKLIPNHGVYCGKAKRSRCAVNIGARPTFGAGKTVIEVLIIKFRGNLYDRRLKVELCGRLRDELQFSDVEKLKEQIRKDVAKCSALVL